MTPPDADALPTRSETTAALTRGARRALAARGGATLTEFSPTKGLRVDIVALDGDGLISVYEVKSGLEDWRADHKWTRYRDWCDRLYFCVGVRFPIDQLPQDVGVMRVDGYDGQVLRSAPEHRLSPARRRSLMVKVAREACKRLHRIEDDGLVFGEGDGA